MIEVVLNFVQVAWQLLCDFMQPQGHDGQTLAVAPVIIAGMIGAASSIANGIFGSDSARKERKVNQAAIDRQRREARNWRDRFVNQDATQTAATSRMLTRMNNIIQKRNMAAAGKRAVIGGTGAVEAATQQANAEAMGNAMSDIVANHEARADKAEMQYQQTKSQLDAQETQMNAQAEAAKRNAMAQAATGVVNSAASVIGAMGDSAGSSKGTSGNQLHTDANVTPDATVTSTQPITDNTVTTTPVQKTTSPVEANVLEGIKKARKKTASNIFDLGKQARDWYDPKYYDFGG